MGADAPLSLTRTYRSNWSTESSRPESGLGLGWTHSHSMVLKAGSGTAATAVKMSSGRLRAKFCEGRRLSLERKQQQRHARARHLRRLDLHAFGERHHLRVRCGWKIARPRQRNGWTHVYSYDEAGRLASVSNPFGRRLDFSYDASGLLRSVTTPDGRVIAYAFDAARSCRGHSTRTAGRAVFLYENAHFPQALTGIVDESRVAGAPSRTTHRRARHRHRTGRRGRALPSQLSICGRRDRHRSAGHLAPLPLRHQRQGKFAVTASPLPSGTGEPDAASRVQDANGLVTSETDFKGVRTETTWDVARRLPLSVTDAAGTPEARTVTTQWHATFALPVLVTEPGRSTAFTYDALGQPAAANPRRTPPRPEGADLGLDLQPAGPGGQRHRAQRRRHSLHPRRPRQSHQGGQRARPRNPVCLGQRQPPGRQHRPQWRGHHLYLGCARPAARRTVGGQQTTAFSYTPFGGVETVSLPGGLS